MRQGWHWAVVGVWFAVTLPCAAETLHPDSVIVAVTVFPDRAGITREASLELKPGSHAIEIGPLPSQVDPDSVSAKGLGDSEVILYGVRLVTKQLESAQDPNVKTLEEEIKKLTRRQTALTDTKQILEHDLEREGKPADIESFAAQGVERIAGEGG